MLSKVSIIIPILNETDNLVKLFDTIHHLTPAPQQVIVVDGGSLDHSVIIANRLINDFSTDSLSTIDWQVMDSSVGRAMQMNAGAALATGDILLFLHADTQLPHDAITHITRVIGHANNKYRWGRFDVRLDSRHPMLWLVGTMINVRSRLTGIATGDQAIFIDKVLFDTIGGYPMQPLMEDIELCKTLKGVAKPACLTSKVTTSARRWRQYGTWRTIILMWQLRFDYWRGVSADNIKARYYKN